MLRHSIQRRALKVFVAAGAVGITLFVAGLPVFVFPKTDDLDRADAIVVLGGPGDGREEYARDLAESGIAPVLVYSNPYGPEAIAMTRRCDARPENYAVLCFDPSPATTRGEAQQIARLAEANGWQKIVVLTYVSHVSRARYIIGKCFTGDVLMADPRPARTLISWVREYPYQTAGFVRAALQAGC